MSMRNGEWIPLEVSISKRFWYERNERERGVGRREERRREERRREREREKGRLPILPLFFLALSLSHNRSTISTIIIPVYIRIFLISSSSSIHSLTQSSLIHFTHIYTLFCCSAIRIIFTRRQNDHPHCTIIIFFLIFLRWMDIDELVHHRPIPRCPLKQWSLFFLLLIPSNSIGSLHFCDSMWSFFRFPSIEKRREEKWG